VRSLKYRLGRRWLRAHTTLVVSLAVGVGIVVYVLTR
jgi:hypothetical protein